MREMRQMQLKLEVRPRRIPQGHRSIVLEAQPSRRRWFSTKTTTCTFTFSGGAVGRDGPLTGVIITTALKPGRYTVTAHYAQSAAPWDQADAAGVFDVV
jgi:hypothetical protein